MITSTNDLSCRHRVEMEQTGNELKHWPEIKSPDRIGANTSQMCIFTACSPQNRIEKTKAEMHTPDRT